jgi:hypothetical protein
MCIKLVIKTSLYYDAQSEKHQVRRACSSFFVTVHASAPYDTTSLISVLYNRILVALNKSLLLKRLIAAKYGDFY